MSRKESIRAKAKERLHRWAEAEGWVVLDTETTGSGHVIEIAVLSAGGEVLVDTLVQSQYQSVSKNARQVHGISDEDLEGAPTWNTVAEDLKEAIAGRTVLAYNAEFDLSRLTRTLEDHGYAEAPDAGGDDIRWPNEVGCVMKEYARARGEWRSKFQSYEWVSLQEAARKEGVAPGKDLHRARADADLARRLVGSFGG